MRCRRGRGRAESADQERSDQGRIVIEAITAAAELSFVRSETHFADASRAAGLCRRLRQSGATPLHADLPAAENYVLLGSADPGDDLWGALWDLRAEPRVNTAFAERVMPQCPLLSAERGRAIVSPIGLQAPADSAWVCMGVDLPRFARDDGVVDETALKRCLEACVDVGEALHDSLVWPTADMQHDAWLNRRLAIVLSGFGDLLRIRGMAPADHASLRYLNQLLLWFRMNAQARSRAIAMRTEPLPAISLSDPSHSLPRGSIREDWRRRWREAVRATLVRHRNLLVVSPWSLFPSEARADYEYAELLPLLRHADACAFRRNVSIDHWNFSQFKHFHQRARAVLKQRVATSQIAEHV
jgi:hypothetical protein